MRSEPSLHVQLAVSQNASNVIREQGSHPPPTSPGKLLPKTCTEGLPGKEDVPLPMKMAKET